MSDAGERTTAPDWSAVPLDSKSGHELIRSRVATYGSAMALAGAFFLLANTQVGFLLMGVPINVYLGLLSVKLHGVVVTLFAIEWWLCKRGQLSAAAYNWLDAVTLVTAMSLYAVVLSLDAHGYESGLVLALITVSHVVSHAVIVPASARRAFWLSSLACTPMVVAGYFIAAAMPAAALTKLPFLPWFCALYLGLWGVVTVAIARLTARVIYGLAQKLKDATQLGQYTIEEKIGEGGMGIVYRARHALLRRPTAIKLLPKARAGEQSLLRFEREVQLTSQLSHPNTIAIYDYGHTPDGVFYYAMEYLDGVTLDELIAHDGPQPAERVIHILKQLSSALHEAHGLGLIHRDVKPANIMLCSRGGQQDQVKVLDFGLVKEFKNDQVKLSGESTLLGTPLYLAPEAITAPDTVDRRADLYALGAVGYELLAGTSVFAGATVVEICIKHLQEQPLPLSQRQIAVPAALERLLLACLSKDPAKRPQTAREVEHALSAITPEPVWSETRAEAWWDEKGRSIRDQAKRRRSGASAKLTLAVDFSSRAGVTSGVRESTPSSLSHGAAGSSLRG
jgi:serine/threonine-protein kinase